MATNIGNWFENGNKVLDRTQNLNSSGVQTGVNIFPSGIGHASASAAGWVVDGFAALPASKTAAAVIIPIHASVGDTIESYKVIGQIDSAGGAATLDAVLYRVTEAVGGFTSTNIGAITQVSATADTLVGSSKTLATPEVVALGASYFVSVTGTTAASTDIEVISIEVTIV